MAILEIRDSSTPQSSERERELEIKQLITELEIGREALIEVSGKISAYRVSFCYYLDQYNREYNLANLGAKSERKFSILSTDEPRRYIVRRTK